MSNPAAVMNLCVCVCVLGDQPDNCLRVQRAGAAVCLNVASLTAEGIQQSISEVISNPSYRDIAMKLSRISHTYGGVKRAAGSRRRIEGCVVPALDLLFILQIWLSLWRS